MDKSFHSTYHGYDTIDYLKIDDRLGTNADFKQLVRKLHDNNISVIVDGVFNHVGREFWAFKDVIDKFVIKFSESTKDAFDKKRLTEAFEKYLYKQVEAEEKINQNFNIDDKSDMESLLKYVTDDVIKLPLEQKRQMLIRDESFETIRSISNNAFEMAQEAYTSKSDNIDETKVDEMQKKLNELLKSVKAFNKQQAIWLVSEGILDLNFVKNPKTDIMSIRLGRCLQSK